MTIKIKKAGVVKVSISYASLNERDSLIRITIKRRKVNTNVPTTLLQRIQACSTASELMALLFATPLKNEAIMAAFDQRIEQLEREGQTINIQSLKHKNNGSTTHSTPS